MKNLKIGLFIAIFSLLGSNFAPVAAAQYYGRTPSLSVSQEGSVGTIRVNVSNADSYSRVILYARSSGATTWSTTVDSIGQTDSSGYLSVLTYIGSGLSEFYVSVNNTSSSTAYLYGSGGCGYGYGCTGGITFSPSNPSLNVGQSMSVTVNQPYFYSGSYYVSSNSNPSVVSASISGTTINLYGSSSGNSTITVCQNNASTCGSLYVTVGGSSSGNVWFSPSSPTMYVGQSLAVSINSSSYSSSYYGYQNAYYVSSNSNQNVVTASVSGTVLNLYANQNGSATIVVCHSALSYCGTLYVTVSGGSGSLTFSQSSVSMYVGQTSTITAYNNNYGTIYLNSNSNSNVVSPSISGSQINLYALQNGSSTLVFCTNSAASCGTVYVTVGGGSGSGNITFSQSNVSLNAGQSVNVNIYSTYSGNAFYVQGNTNSGAVSASISGSVLYLTGNANGNATITVCQNSNPTCATVYVTVGGGGGSGSVWFSQNNVSINGGQSQTITIYSYNYGNNYYISSNSNSSVVSANVVGNSLNLTGNQSGSSTITVCQQNGSGCGSVYVTVSGGYYGSGVSFSQNSVTLSAGQSTAVTVYGNQPFYISSNTNQSAASATLSGSTLTIYGNNSGNSTVTICQNNNVSCGSIYITVSGGYYGGNLSFTTTSLPNMAVGQYYNYQLQVNGGTTPYNFQLTSGQLPSGLTLNSSGSIYGNPQNSNSTSFTVRVNDNYGRSASANFTINGSGGGVLGTSIYPNGQLIKEDGTIYIVYRGQKSGFASAYVFTSLGFKFGNVLSTGYTNLPNTGYVVNNAAASHPWGAFVQSGQTIYFVHQDGLIPVPSWDIFINNRGASSLVVPANMYDFQRPILSAMSYNDNRLY